MSFLLLGWVLKILFLCCCLGTAVLVQTSYAHDQDAQGEDFRCLTLDGLITSANRAAGTVTSNFVDLGKHRGCVEVTLDVTAVSGSPTLNVTVKHSHDGETWATLGTMTEATLVGSETKIFGPCRRYLQLVGVVAGSGSPHETYAITGKAF